jgi:hypothetical protein
MSLPRSRLALLTLAAAAALALAGAVRSAAQTSSATLPSSSVVWDGLLKVTVGCSLQSGSCTGFLSVRAPGASQSDDLVGGDYSVAAGATKVLSFDPGGDASKQLDSLRSVVVRVEPSMGQGDPFEATLQIEHRSGSGDGSGGGAGPGSPRKSRKHRRYFTIGGFTDKNIYVLWAGELSTHDNGAARCVKRKLVKIQKRVGKHWVTVGATRSARVAKRAHPGWTAKYQTKLLPLEPTHRFRALAPRVKVGRQICLRAVSGSIRGSGKSRTA